MLTVAVAERRILRGVSPTLAYQFLDADGNPAAPAGVVTIGITTADGTDLVTAGTATTGTDTAPRTYALAAVNTLEQLTVTWTDAGDTSTQVQLVDVVGGFFFSAAQARTAETAIADGNEYTTEQIGDARREVEDECEWICAVAFVPRFCRVALDGSGRSLLRTRNLELRTLRAVTVDGDAYSGPELEAVLLDRPAGTLRLPSGHWPAGVGNVTVEYEHGLDRPPVDLVKASIIRLRHRLNMNRSAIPDRAERFVFGDATFVLSMPGQFKTGIPDVDAVYGRYSRREPVPL